MTIIAAVRHGGDTFIGFNNGSVLGGTPLIGSSCPWLVTDDWAFGITGESSVQQILTHEFSKADLSKLSGIDFVSIVKNTLTEQYIGSKNDGEYVTTFGIYAILAHRQGMIWDVSGCLSLTEVPAGTLWAQGSGADYAVGADFALSKAVQGLSATARMELCIGAAIANDINSVGNGVVQKLWS